MARKAKNPKLGTLLQAPVLLGWLRANYPKRQMLQDSHKTALDAALWFVATEEARMLMEDLTVKAVAHVVREGMAGIKTMADLQDWLDTCWSEDDYDTPAAARAALPEVCAELEANLRAFFEIKTKGAK